MNITAIKKSTLLYGERRMTVSAVRTLELKFKHHREKFLALVDRTGVVYLALLGENEKNAFKTQKSIFSHFFVHSLVSYFVWKCSTIGISHISKYPHQQGSISHLPHPLEFSSTL